MFDKCSRGNLDALWISIPLAPSSFNRGEERFFPIHVTLIHPFLSPLNPATSILARVFGVNGARFRDTFILPSRDRMQIFSRTRGIKIIQHKCSMHARSSNVLVTIYHLLFC